MYDKLRNEGKSIPDAVKDLSGGFGAQTKAIEGNLMKLHHLLDQNGYDRMRDLFNQKKTVSEWNKILRTDPKLAVPGQDTLEMQGSGNQKVTGWMVFGPKIGSFINNLHGDYSTLTADLWFSRTWNRLLGHNFIHAPLAEQKQYQDFKDAIKAEFLHHNGLPHEQYAGKTKLGQYQRDKAGNIVPWKFGNDMQDMSHDDFENLVNNPEKMQELATNLYEQYKGGGFKDKSDARRRAKNWMENRDLPVAAPRGDKERDFQQNTVEEAQKLLKKKHGLDISIADIQAALWFHEKELFSKLGVAPERAQPADYADAAKNAMELINKGELYRVKSREKKPAKAYGGAINPIELRYDDLDDTARRLILWSYAATPIVRPLSRAEGGAVDDPVNKALDIVGAGSPTSAVDTARNLTPMGFYSAAAEAASKIPQRAPIDQIINKITGQQNVKKEELANANLKDAFAGQRSVDPKEVARHLQENVPQIREKIYGGKPPVKYSPKPLLYNPEDFEDADEVHRIGPEGQKPHYIVKEGKDYHVYGPSGYHETYDSFNNAVDHANNSINNVEQPLYKEYTIPGGKNYREVVMHLPEEKEAAAQKVTDFYDAMHKKYGENFISKISPEEDIALYRLQAMADVAESKQPYQSSHWHGVANPVAHLRMSDRDNGKTLHVEEVQSDWGQEGRKKGFGKQVTLSPLEEMEYFNLQGMSGSDRTEDQQNRLDELTRKMDASKVKPVPPAPYVSDTNQWVDLGLKRALMEAAKGGYDKLVVTPGEAQADRYDLSKRIQKIVYDPDYKTLSYMEHGGIPGFETIDKIPGDVEPHEIENHIGKEAAAKLLATEPHKLSGNHILEGEDLKVGGKGMNDFYDKLVPQRLNKLIAQHDPSAKVAINSYPLSYKVGTGRTEDIDWHGNPVEEMAEKKVNGHVLHITPKLRAAILKGLPAFKAGGEVGKSPIIDHAFKVLSQYS
jgi:hypothetical protein